MYALNYAVSAPNCYTHTNTPIYCERGYSKVRTHY